MKTSSRTLIPRPYSDSPQSSLVLLQCYVSPAAASFFHMSTGRSPGAINAILTNLISKLHDECTKRGIPERFEPDNESRITDTLNDLSFGPKLPVVPRSPRARRTAAAPPVASPQPPSVRDDTTGTDGPRCPT